MANIPTDAHPPQESSEGPSQPHTSSVHLRDQIESVYEKLGVTRAHKQIMVMILLGAFFDSLEQNAVGITGPLLKEYWSLGTAQIGLLNTVTFTAIATGRITTGLVSDRYGRRPMLMINLIIFAGGSLLCALAPSYGILAVGRAIVGFGLGGEIAVAITMVSEMFAARHRGGAVGLVNVTAAGFGNMLAPAFGVLVFAIFSFSGDERWRWVFALLFIPALLVLYFRRYVPETPRYLASRGKMDEANMVINRYETGKLHGPIDNPKTYIFLPEGAESVVVDSKPPAGSWKDVFRGKYLKRTILMATGLAMSFAGQISVLTLMPTILVERGNTLTASLWFTLLMQSGSLVGALFAVYFATRLPRRKVVLYGAMLGILAGLSLAFLANSMALIVLFGFFFNFAVIILNTTIYLWAPELYPTRFRGFGTSVVLATGSLSGGLFPILAGALFDSGGLFAMFGMLAACFVVLAVVTRFVPETFGKPMEEEDLVVITD